MLSYITWNNPSTLWVNTIILLAQMLIFINVICVCTQYSSPSEICLSIRVYLSTLAQWPSGQS